jgi:hypothetical protein
MLRVDATQMTGFGPFPAVSVVIAIMPYLA